MDDRAFPMIRKAVDHYLMTAGGCTPGDVEELREEMELLEKLFEDAPNHAQP